MDAGERERMIERARKAHAVAERPGTPGEGAAAVAARDRILRAAGVSVDEFLGKRPKAKPRKTKAPSEKAKDWTNDVQKSYELMTFVKLAEKYKDEPIPWVTISGRKWKPEQLGDDSLMRAIETCEDQGKTWHPIYGRLIHEARTRGRLNFAEEVDEPKGGW